MRPMRIAQVLIGLTTSVFLAHGGCGQAASGLSTDGAAKLDTPASTGGSLGGSGGPATGGAGGTASTDAATVAEAGADTPPSDPGCSLLCIASNSDIGITGHVDLATADAAAIDVDALQVTICLDGHCVVLPRRSYEDAQAMAWACADAGSDCMARVFGGNSAVAGTMFAYVTLTGNGGNRYTVAGSVMFPFSSSVADVASTTRITIASGDLVYLDALSTDCTVNLGCCGNLLYQSCKLTWN